MVFKLSYCENSQIIPDKNYQKMLDHESFRAQECNNIIKYQLMKNCVSKEINSKPREILAFMHFNFQTSCCVPYISHRNAVSCKNNLKPITELFQYKCYVKPLLLDKCFFEHKFIKKFSFTWSKSL